MKTKPESRTSKPGLQTYLLGGIVGITTLIVGYLLLVYDRPPGDLPDPAVSKLQLKDIPFDGVRAMEYLKQVCAIGPRKSGTAGMADQQKLIIDHFTKFGAKVDKQEFRVRDPIDGSAVEMANIIIQWQPEAKERIMLCSHYDTRPFPDQDRKNPRGRFVSANDGGSGVAIMMAMAHDMAKIKPKAGVGIDFVLFDGEELVYAERGDYFLGSDYFSQEYVHHPPAYTYRNGVLLDMVGGTKLQLFQERNSISWKNTKAVVDDLWGVARKLGVTEFALKPKHEVRDDHLRLNLVAKIPVCDVIDFDYPHWHTTGDVPENCSDLSLAKVGWVLEEWLKKEVNK